MSIGYCDELTLIVSPGMPSICLLKPLGGNSRLYCFLATSKSLTVHIGTSNSPVKE